MTPLLIFTKALSVTIRPIACGTPKLLLPLNSHPIMVALVPAPLICTSISEGSVVNSKTQPESVIREAFVCTISN